MKGIEQIENKRKDGFAGTADFLSAISFVSLIVQISRVIPNIPFIPFIPVQYSFTKKGLLQKKN
jgi:hypothetical protein